MSYWSILEIDPTAEVSTIKKTYAKKLKIYHPEDDPEGYQRLREAYDYALKYAKSKPQITVEKREVALEGNSIFEPKEIICPTDNIFEHREVEKNLYVDYDIDISKGNIFEECFNEIDRPKNPIEGFFTRLNQIYSDFQERIEIKNWEEVLNTDLMWDLKYMDVINSRMIYFLIDNSNLPKNIWRLLNDNFHWDEQEEYLRSRFPSDFVGFLFDQISNTMGLRYSYLPKNNEIDYDLFIDYRRIIFNALANEDIKGVEEYLFRTLEIYSHDPDLLCMKGEYYLRIRDNTRHEKAFQDAIDINPEDISTLFYEADIYFKNNRIDKAEKLCKYILSIKPKDLNTNTLLAKCYLKSKKWYMANEILIENLKLSPNDKETKQYLYLIVKELNVQYKKKPLNRELRNNLKNTYLALGEYRKTEELKPKLKDLLPLLKKLIIILIIAFCVITLAGLGIILIFASKGTLIPVIIIASSVLNKRKKK